MSSDKNPQINASRRRALGRSVMAAGGVLAYLLPTSASAWLTQSLQNTPGEIVGPFYPVMKPLDQDADLTVIAGKTARAQGQVIHLMGRVLNQNKQPVAGARVEIWQANTHGRYTHPSDKNPAPLDPNFEGFGVQTTDSEGRYYFKTIKPGAYPNSTAWTRPPHIHFEVIGKRNRLTTQMYFPGEPLNDIDILLQSLRFNKQGAIAKIFPPSKDQEPDSFIVAWDIVLDLG